MSFLEGKKSSNLVFVAWPISIDRKQKSESIEITRDVINWLNDVITLERKKWLILTYLELWRHQLCQWHQMIHHSTQFLILHRLVPFRWPWRQYFDYFRFQPSRISGQKFFFGILNDNKKAWLVNIFSKCLSVGKKIS